jgi:hypothetical protein
MKAVRASRAAPRNDARPLAGVRAARLRTAGHARAIVRAASITISIPVLADTIRSLPMRLVGPLLVLCGAASLAGAQVSENLRSCAAEPDNARRLACYDKEMAHLTPAAPAHDAVPSTASGTPDAVPATRFGLSDGQVRKRQAGDAPAEVKALTAHVTKVIQLPNGRQRIALDNEQEWEQTEQDGGFNPQPGATAIITRGKLGGFWMATDPYRRVRVKRIR